MPSSDSSQSDVLQAVAAIHAGGVIAYPTEAVFGLGCDPLNAQALQRIVTLKQRPLEKGLILIAASVDQVIPWIHPIDPARWQQVLATWPGPVTWVLPASEQVLPELCGSHATIAIRVTAHPVAAALCQAVGSAIVSTSANISGQPPARSRAEVIVQFPAGIDAIVDGVVNRQAKPSEIRDAQTGAVLRPA